VLKGDEVKAEVGYSPLRKLSSL